VLYVDAENTFSAKRALQIAEARGYDVKEVAKRVHCVRATSSAHQILLMDKINEEAKKYPVRLLIIDSIISHFRNEYVGRGALAERQQQLNRYL
jgi:DNA repair protein RadA